MKTLLKSILYFNHVIFSTCQYIIISKYTYIKNVLINSLLYLIKILCLHYFKGISVHSVMPLERTRIQDVIAQKILTKCALSKANNL